MIPDVKLVKIVLAAVKAFKDNSGDVVGEFDDVRQWINTTELELIAVLKLVEGGGYAGAVHTLQAMVYHTPNYYRVLGIKQLLENLQRHLACVHDWHISSTGGMTFSGGRVDDDIHTFHVCIKCGAILDECHD